MKRALLTIALSFALAGCGTSKSKAPAVDAGGDAEVTFGGARTVTVRVPARYDPKTVTGRRRDGAVVHGNAAAIVGYGSAAIDSRDPAVVPCPHDRTTRGPVARFTAREQGEKR